MPGGIAGTPVATAPPSPPPPGEAGGRWYSAAQLARNVILASQTLSWDDLLLNHVLSLDRLEN